MISSRFLTILLILLVGFVMAKDLQLKGVTPTIIQHNCPESEIWSELQEKCILENEHTEIVGWIKSIHNGVLFYGYKIIPCLDH